MTFRAHDTSYYDQQRQGLLKRHGIDLEEPSGSTPKKMDRKKVEELMGGEQGLLTWRDKNRRKMAFSVAGTNSYMAVEVIRGTGYQFSCDWWSAGVMLVFHCLSARARRNADQPIRSLQHVRGAVLLFSSCGWSLTCELVLKCLYGYPPFVSSSRQQTRQKIIVSPLNRRLHWSVDR